MVTSMLVGKRLDDYILIEILGRGPIATMFRGRNIETGEVVALKVYPASLLEEYVDFETVFETDARKLQELKHPDIVPINKVGRYDDRLYLVMPFLGGGSLEDRLNAEYVPNQEEISRVLKAVTSALDYAHKEGYLHRNLAPSNILFDTDGKVYLSDFDIPCVRKAVTRITGSGMVGKSSYAAPEIANGEPPISEQTDIYALGAILYQMITGRTPYVAETPIKQVMLHLTQEVPAASHINPQMGRAVDTVIYQAMAKQVKNRFRTAGALYLGYEEALEIGDDTPVKTVMLPGTDDDEALFETYPYKDGVYTPPTQDWGDEPPDDPSGNGIGTSGKLPWYVVAAVIAFLILAWGAVGMMIGGQYKEQADYSTMVASNATGTFVSIQGTLDAESTATSEAIIAATGTQTAISGALTAVAALPTDQPTVTPTPTDTPIPTATPSGGSGGKIALLSDQSGSIELYTLDVTTLEFTQITDNDLLEDHPVWSPDGRYIAFQMVEPLTGLHIMIADTLTGELTNLTEGIRDDSYPVWSQDGDLVMYLHQEGQYFTLNTMPLVPTTLDDEEEVIAEFGQREIVPLRWQETFGLVDYFGVGSEEALEVLEFDLATGESFALTQMRGAIEWVDYSPDGTKAIYSILFLNSGRTRLVLADAICDDPFTLDTCNAVVLTSEDYNYYKPHFSPDGNMILAISDRGGSLDVWMLNLEGQAILQLTDLGSSEFDAVWQPMN